MSRIELLYIDAPCEMLFTANPGLGKLLFLVGLGVLS